MEGLDQQYVNDTSNKGNKMNRLSSTRHSSQDMKPDEPQLFNAIRWTDHTPQVSIGDQWFQAWSLTLDKDGYKAEVRMDGFTVKAHQNF